MTEKITGTLKNYFQICMCPIGDKNQGELMARTIIKCNAITLSMSVLIKQ